MKLKDKNMSEKSKKWSISIVMYVVASIVALVGVALLVDNIYTFSRTVNNYVAQGYTMDNILSGLVPSTLLPGIFEPIAVYGGIAFVLFGVGKVNKKVSKCLTLLTKVDVCNDTILEQNVVDLENRETN